MSRIGKKPVPIPAGVTVEVNASRVSVKGPKGELACDLHAPVGAAVRDGAVHVTCAGGEGARFHGLSRSLIANMIEGVTGGYGKELELQGVGFRASAQGNELSLTLGFASPVEYVAPPGIAVQVKDNVISVSGADKQMVGDVAARIRSFFPPEPYKGKGVRYKGEHVRRKAGKTVA